MIQLTWLNGPAPYLSVWQAMRDYTQVRHADSPDVIWLVEHAPVYTLGQAGKPEHVLNPGNIPLVKCDRGGQVTYHGPGQVVVYPLLDLRRYKLFVRDYVQLLEDVAIDTLYTLGITEACRKPGAPGVYVPQANGELAKIAALGIKIRNGCAYHGLAMNVDMDLSPFLGINPCGYEGLVTTDLRSCGVRAGVINVGERLAGSLRSRLLARL
jgi:lipoyl(octanoyl) transferase